MLEEIENDPDLPAAEAEAREILSEYAEQKEQPAPFFGPASNMRSNLKWLIPAAIIVGASLIIKPFLFDYSTERLYQSYYEPMDQDLLQLRAIRSIESIKLQQGINCYKDADYACAVDAFSSLPDEPFLLGLAQLGAENYQEALSSLLNSKADQADNPGTDWYLGLAYLKLGQLDEAFISFDQIPGTNMHYGKDSQKLKARIRKVKAAREV